MAYYRNYTSKEDILTEYLDELFEKYLEEMEQISGINAYQFASKFFAYFREQKIFLKNINKAGLSGMILDRFDKYLQSIVEKVLSVQTQEKIDPYQIHFWAGGLYKVLIAWIENDFRKNDDELAHIVRNFSAPMKTAD
ncbi:MAG: TetR/AcrR family transcriptional regulator C-terminal domain-containing protein [Lachnospiraceae bacterium]|nr:TetR/AcrR family transcriptional regulator C-terminal domain-containing protein [Lachnospiraceae bacterium]